MKENNCTLWPDAWYSDCCKAHDLAYETQAPKTEADIALFKCVADSGYAFPSFLVAALMFAGVSFFGYRFYKKYKIQ
ncbi:hypothetical protein D3C85_1687620 [compost metagenome]